MTVSEWASWAQAFFGFATFAAACLAVKAAYDAPQKAAKFAETLRSNSQKADESRRLKLLVFTNLMENRAQLLHPASVASLNLIDVVYKDHREVREAWRHFLVATNAIPYNDAVTIERYMSIIEKMARALGIDGEISVEDVKNVYYPKGYSDVEEIAHYERQQKLRHVRSVPPVVSASETLSGS